MACLFYILYIMKYFSHLNSAAEMIRLYDGRQPFHLYSKDFFKQNKKYGSKDRKSIAHLCYCYFRIGHTLQDESIADRILYGLFLCSDTTTEALQSLKPEWNEQVGIPVKDKCKMFSLEYPALNLFPLLNELSDGIEREPFNLSHLQQPDLFIRIRPGYRDSAIKKLEESAIHYSMPAGDCIAIPNTTKIDAIFDMNKEVVVQDYSSQRISGFIQLTIENVKSSLQVWDCCAASGGKSILANDILKDIELTVSDIRASILINLKKRFAEAGINQYKSFIADLTKPGLQLKKENYQLIIADLPCSGSGTWGRTPEQLCYFDENTINEYSAIQKKIVANIIPCLEKKGYLLYITCSVFKKENEDMVKWLQSAYRLELIKMEILKGYTIKADTMFAALLIKK
jgi:16S rRNA (cytosine967-C5)-methyltransferase